MTAGCPVDAEPFLRKAARQIAGDPAPHINLSTALIALNRPEEAVRAASDACFLAPQQAEAHYAYADAWSAVGNIEQADFALSDAVRLAPRFVEAWINLGLARYRQGLLFDAKIAMRRALALDPVRRSAFANLATFRRLTGEHEGLEAELRAFLEADPAAVVVRLALGQTLAFLDRSDEALKLLDMPAPSGLADRQVWALQKSGYLLNAGRYQEAAQPLAETGPLPRDLAPLKAWREGLLALAAGDDDAADQKAAEIENTLARLSDTMLPDHAIEADFSLADFWRRRRDTPRAFEYWRRGHERLGKLQPFSQQTTAAESDESRSHARIHRRDAALGHDAD